MNRSKALVRLLFLALAALWLQGCALQSPPYSPSLANVDAMKRSAMRPVVLGSFTVTSGMQGGSSIGLRGNPMSSSVGSDYAAYLKEALRQELVVAGKLDAKSDLEVGATLIKNDIAAAGFATNSGEIEARFVVRQAGALRYDAVKRAEASWESSFVGGIAIPKAQQQYPLLVQQLVARLLADPAFLAALK
jgi:hypothetical protein